MSEWRAGIRSCNSQQQHSQSSHGAAAALAQQSCFALVPPPTAARARNNSAPRSPAAGVHACMLASRPVLSGCRTLYSPQRYHMLRAQTSCSPSANPTSSIIENHSGQLRRSDHRAYTSLRGRGGQGRHVARPCCCWPPWLAPRGAAPPPLPLLHSRTAAVHPPDGFLHAGRYLVLQRDVCELQDAVGRVACGGDRGN